MEKSPYHPRILVAMPGLQDGFFEKAVILLAEYNQEGAMGFVINSPSATCVNELLTELGLPSHPTADCRIMIGGPVQGELCWVIHSRDLQESSTTPLGENLALSAAQDVLSAMANGTIPNLYVVGVGYAGWGPGQLDDEIEQGAWWLCDTEPLSVLSHPAEDRWRTIMDALGLNTPYCTLKKA